MSPIENQCSVQKKDVFATRWNVVVVVVVVVVVSSAQAFNPSLTTIKVWAQESFCVNKWWKDGLVIPHIDIRTQNDQQESYWFSARWPCQHQHVVSALLVQNTNWTCVCVKEEEMVQKDKREERERVQLNGNCNDPTHLPIPYKNIFVSVYR